MFGHLVENVSRGVLACGPLPLARPVLQEAPQALAQIPAQIMVPEPRSTSRQSYSAAPGSSCILVKSTSSL